MTDPWTLQPSYGGVSWLVCRDGGLAHAVFNGPRAEQDAKLCCLAVNAHAALLAACEQALRDHDREMDHLYRTSPGSVPATLTMDTIAALRAAVALGKGEQSC